MTGHSLYPKMGPELSGKIEEVKNVRPKANKRWE